MEARTYYDDGHDCEAIEYCGEHVKVKIDLLDENGRFAYVDWIEVTEEFQGQGIGTSAIKELAKIYQAVYLAPTNENNARLYARLGEQVIGDDVEASEDTYFYYNNFDCLYYLDQGYGVYEVA